MKTYLNITRIIFLLIISLYALYFVNFPKIISDWVVVDLLINYEGGFVRRGLLGQLNLFFEKELNFSNLLFSIIIICVIYFINITATYLRLPNNKNRFFLFLLIFLSPATFLFYIYDINSLFRKDVFIILSFIIHCVYVQLNLKKLNFSQNYQKKLFILIFIICLITLIHEVQFFMLSFHILLSYSIIRNYKLVALFYIFPVLTFIVTWMFSGNYLLAEDIRQSLNHYPKDMIYKNYNPIHWLEGNIGLVIGGFIKYFFYYTYSAAMEFLITIFLSIFLFWNILLRYFNQFYLENINLSAINLKFIKDNSYKFFIFSFLLFFFIGFDAGRAMHFLTMHIISFFLIFIPKKEIFTFFSRNNNYKYLIIFVLICYFSVWILPTGYAGMNKVHTMFQSGLLQNIKLIFAYFVNISSNFVQLPAFLQESYADDFIKKYLIFNTLPKF